VALPLRAVVVGWAAELLRWAVVPVVQLASAALAGAVVPVEEAAAAGAVKADVAIKIVSREPDHPGSLFRYGPDL